MASSENLSHLNAHLRPLAEALRTAAATEAGEPWVAVVLDVRFDDAGGFSDKVRVQRRAGAEVSVSLPMPAVHALIALELARPTGTDRWYGLLVRVTVDGACDVRFNYDQACADDPAFYAS